MAAATNGDLEGLTQILAEEATLWADGGGKVRGAATRPVSGREAVARFMLGAAARFTPVGASIHIVAINGLPGLLVRDGTGKPFFVASIGIRDGRIDRVWITANPDKLQGLE
jgi:RNA polymerase sigma-70 factor (ECF subfamily)